MILGEPGAGKTSALRWLIESTDDDPALAEIRDRFAAAYFCGLADDGPSPLRFVKRVAEQLAAKVEGFSEALLDSHRAFATRKLHATSEISAHAVSGTIIGILIQELQLGTPSPTDALCLAVVDPLTQALRVHPPSRDVVIVVDALDVAARSTLSIPSLLASTPLPPMARLLLATRDNPDATRFARDTAHVIRMDTPAARQEVRTYVQTRLPGPEHRGKAVAAASQAGANFLLAHALSGDRSDATGELDPLELRELSLERFFRSSLNAVSGSETRSWFDGPGRVLGLLAVARGKGFTEDELRNVLGSNPRQVLHNHREFLAKDSETGRLRLFHESFAEFLLGKGDDPDFSQPEDLFHQLVVDFALKDKNRDWSYGGEHLVHHVIRLEDLELLRRVLTIDWFLSRSADPRGSLVDLLDDLRELCAFLARGLGLRAREGTDAENPETLAELLQGYLMIGSLHSQLESIPPKILPRLHRADLLSWQGALELADGLQAHRASALAYLAEAAPSGEKLDLIQRAMDALETTVPMDDLIDGIQAIVDFLDGLELSTPLPVAVSQELTLTRPTPRPPEEASPPNATICSELRTRLAVLSYRRLPQDRFIKLAKNLWRGLAETERIAVVDQCLEWIEAHGSDPDHLLAEWALTRLFGMSLEEGALFIGSGIWQQPENDLAPDRDSFVEFDRVEQICGLAEGLDLKERSRCSRIAQEHLGLIRSKGLRATAMARAFPLASIEQQRSWAAEIVEIALRDDVGGLWRWLSQVASEHADADLAAALLKRLLDQPRYWLDVVLELGRATSLEQGRHLAEALSQRNFSEAGKYWWSHLDLLPPDKQAPVAQQLPLEETQLHWICEVARAAKGCTEEARAVVASRLLKSIDAEAVGHDREAMKWMQLGGAPTMRFGIRGHFEQPGRERANALMELAELVPEDDRREILKRAWLESRRHHDRYEVLKLAAVLVGDDETARGTRARVLAAIDTFESPTKELLVSEAARSGIAPPELVKACVESRCSYLLPCANHILLNLADRLDEAQRREVFERQYGLLSELEGMPQFDQPNGARRVEALLELGSPEGPSAEQLAVLLAKTMTLHHPFDRARSSAALLHRYDVTGDANGSELAWAAFWASFRSLRESPLRAAVLAEALWTFSGTDRGAELRELASSLLNDSLRLACDHCRECWAGVVTPVLRQEVTEQTLRAAVNVDVEEFRTESLRRISAILDGETPDRARAMWLRAAEYSSANGRSSLCAVLTDLDGLRRKFGAAGGRVVADRLLDFAEKVP